MHRCIMSIWYGTKFTYILAHHLSLYSNSLCILRLKAVPLHRCCATESILKTDGLLIILMVLMILMHSLVVRNRLPTCASCENQMQHLGRLATDDDVNCRYAAGFVFFFTFSGKMFVVYLAFYLIRNHNVKVFIIFVFQ